MADYYTKLSALLPLSREALDFLLRAEAVLEDEDRAVPADLGLTTEEREMLEDEGFRPSGADYEWIAREEAIWVHGDDADPGTIAELARSGELVRHIAATLWRVGLGFAFGDRQQRESR